MDSVYVMKKVSYHIDIYFQHEAVINLTTHFHHLCNRCLFVILAAGIALKNTINKIEYLITSKEKIQTETMNKCERFLVLTAGRVVT